MYIDHAAREAYSQQRNSEMTELLFEVFNSKYGFFAKGKIFRE
jgi:hypothetical protein